MVRVRAYPPFCHHPRVRIFLFLYLSIHLARRRPKEEEEESTTSLPAGKVCTVHAYIHTYILPSWKVELGEIMESKIVSSFSFSSFSFFPSFLPFFFLKKKSDGSRSYVIFFLLPTSSFPDDGTLSSFFHFHFHFHAVINKQYSFGMRMRMQTYLSISG